MDKDVVCIDDDENITGHVEDWTQIFDGEIPPKPMILDSNFGKAIAWAPCHVYKGNCGISTGYQSYSVFQANITLCFVLGLHSNK